MNKNDNALYYSIARIFAKQGKMEEAWKWLNAAADKGFNYYYVLNYDSYLETLRNTPRWNGFMNLITKKKTNIPVIHKRISEGGY